MLLSVCISGLYSMADVIAELLHVSLFLRVHHHYFAISLQNVL